MIVIYFWENHSESVMIVTNYVHKTCRYISIQNSFGIMKNQKICDQAWENRSYLHKIHLFILNNWTFNSTVTVIPTCTYGHVITFISFPAYHKTINFVMWKLWRIWGIRINSPKFNQSIYPNKCLFYEDVKQFIKVYFINAVAVMIL